MKQFFKIFILFYSFTIISLENTEWGNIKPDYIILKHNGEEEVEQPQSPLNQEEIQLEELNLLTQTKVQDDDDDCEKKYKKAKYCCDAKFKLC